MARVACRVLEAASHSIKFLALEADSLFLNLAKLVPSSRGKLEV